jgi:hypothetical protein
LHARDRSARCPIAHSASLWDFPQPGGKLYVLAAEKIIPSLLQQLGKTTKSFCMGRAVTEICVADTARGLIYRG